jgi:membrane protease YdiL (CAAX protease family)
MIIQDRISMSAFAIATFITIYLAVFQTTAIITFPLILLLAGISMEYMLEREGSGFKKTEKPDTKLDKKDISTTLYYATFGFVGLMITGYSINYVGFAGSLQITSFDNVLYSALMAISEEMFFRGFVFDLFLSAIKFHWIAIFLSAGVFAVYHLAVYSTEFNSLLFVFAGGLILSWITLKTRRLGPSILAHSANNIFATIGVWLI